MNIRLLGLTFLSALLFSIALPNELLHYGLPLMGLIALVPLFMAFYMAETKLQARLTGLFFMLFHFPMTNYWLAFFKNYSIYTIGATTIYMGLVFFIIGPWIQKIMKSESIWRPVFIAITWTAYEYFKSSGFLAYPWGLAAYPFNEMVVLNQIAEVAGIWPLSFTAALLNALGAEFIIQTKLFTKSFSLSNIKSITIAKDKRFPSIILPAGTTALIICTLFVYGTVRINTLAIPDKNIKVSLIQPNIDSWVNNNALKAIQINQKLTDQALQAYSPDLVIWSETTLRFDYREIVDANFPAERPMKHFINTKNTPFLMGGPYIVSREDSIMYNASILTEKDGSFKDFYGKRQLVPFAELIPFWDVDFVRTFFTRVIGMYGTWSMGPDFEPMISTKKDGEEIKMGTPICFEDAFSYVTKEMAELGADVFVNHTNDAWSKTVSAQTQHLVAARYRSIETRRPLIRATNGGVTTIIDIYGSTTEEAPMFQRTFLNTGIEYYSEPPVTFFMIAGDWFAIICSAAFIYLLNQDRIKSLLNKQKK